MNRRNFVAGTTVALAAGAAQSQASKPAGSSLPKIPRPVLPYSKDALSPVISEKQLQAHHGLHHVGYYDRLVSLLPQFELSDLTLEQAIRAAKGEQEMTAVYNSAGQLYAHNLYFASLAPAARPAAEAASVMQRQQRIDENLSDALRSRIARDFGSPAGAIKVMADTASKHFSNGWLWLSRRTGGELAIYTTPNAVTPLDQGETPLLAIDLWEHAYYLDHLAARAAHVQAVLNQILNWRTASQRYDRT